MYQVVDKDLNIMACKIEDLTTTQVTAFLNGWNDANVKIGDLAVFGDKTGAVILNMDNADYDNLLDFTRVYLKAVRFSAEETIKKLGELYPHITPVLNRVIKLRPISYWNKIAGNKPFKVEGLDMEYMYYLMESLNEGKMQQLHRAFIHGYVVGIREERKKKKNALCDRPKYA